MPGYRIFEERFLKPYKSNGFEQNPDRIGFLNFLRELKNHAAGLPKFGGYCVFGLDELLYMEDEANRKSVAADIHRQLYSAAKQLERKLLDVHIVCKGKLVRDDTLWLDYRKERLPINVIFGDLPKQEDKNGNEFYMVGFNLIIRIEKTSYPTYTLLL